MAMNVSTQGNFPTSIPDAWFKKELLNFGDFSLLYRRFAKKERLPEGNGKTWKANRYSRLELPMDALSEGVTPDDMSLTIEQVSCTAAQYGMVVTLTDVMQLVYDHPVLQKAVELVRDSMDRLDAEIICEALLAGTNVIYADSADPDAETARSGLESTDVMETATLKAAINDLEFPDDTWGSAPRINGSYVCILHRKHELDLLNDSLWKDMAIRQDKSALEKGMVARWMGVDFYTTNFGPKFTNLGTTNAAPASGNPRITSVASPAGDFTGANYDFTWTRRHKHRRFEEGISGVITVAMTNLHSAKFEAPTNSSYVYNLYVGTSGGTRYKALSNVAASSTNYVSTVPTSGSVAPVAPATGVTVYCSWVMGKDAYAVVDLQDVDAGITPDARTGEDPLKQRRKVSAKFFLGALILADNNIVRVEAASNF